MSTDFGSYEWPPQGNGSGGVSIYPTLGDFPASAVTGSLAVAADTGNLYEFNGATWVLEASPTGAITGLGAFGSTPNADGLSITSNLLNMQPASATEPGGVSITTQSFAGQKQFNNGINLPNGQTIQANGTTVFIADSTSDFNLFVGNNAGNQTLTGINNTAIGSYAMPSLTAGSNNMAFGYTAGNGLINGNNNVAIGSAALTTCHAGSNNIAIGLNSLSTATVSANVAIGVNALEQITTGANNTALGFQAGLNGSPALQTNSNSTFIGYNSTATTDGLTNSTALGAGATITASNQMVFGNSSVTANVFNGTTSATQYISTIATGTAPLVVTSTTQVANLNAATAGIAPAGTLSGTTLNSTVVSSSLTSLGVQAQALNLGSNLINAVSNPVSAQDAATKAYVDASIAALNPAEAVYAATTATIAGTYVSVGGGVGDTFTTTSTATFTVDGTTPSLGARILIKNQTDGTQNGIYTFTTLPVTSVSGAVFTRSLDYNTPAEMNTAGLIPVINGTVNALSSWQQVANIVSIGPAGTALVFTEFTANPSLYLLKANNLSDVQSKATSYNNLSPMTTTGDIEYEVSTGTAARLAIGSAGNVLTVSGGVPTWAAPAIVSLTAGVSGILPIANGGTNGTTANAGFNNLSPLTTKGDTLVYTTVNARQAVPPDYGGLVPDSTQTSGWRNSTYTQDLQGRPGKNYVQYADFENNSTTGWSWANVGTLTNGLPTGTPSIGAAVTNAFYAFTISTSTTCAAGDTYTNNTQTFTVVTALSAQSGTVFFATGTGAPAASGTLTRATGSGTSSITFSASTNEAASIVSSGQLAGAYSLSVASSAATVAGLGIQTNFLIDTEDQAKVLTVKFYYSVPTNGTANFSGTSSNSFAWAAYDVTNSSWLTSAGNFNLVQLTGTGYCTGTFQTNATTSNIRFFVYNANATGGATTIYLDDFYVGPQTAPMGPAMTDWVAYTPTFTNYGTQTSVSFFSRRDGDSLEIMGTFTPGSGTGSAGSISLGYNGGNANVTADTTKLVSGTNLVGHAAYNAASTTLFTSEVLIQSSTPTVLNLGVQNSTTAGITVASGGTFGAKLNIYAKVPIVGWSSNTAMSADTDTRVITSQFSGAAASAGSGAIIIFPTSNYDSSGSYSVSTGRYTAPVTGYYNIAGMLTGNASVGYNAYINGASNVFIGFATSASGNAVISGQVKLNAGDLLDIRPNATSGVMSASANVSVTRVSGPAVITATESVNAFYTGTPTGTLTTAFNTATYPTKVKDTHNEYSSGTYTIPVSGSYSISAGFSVTASSITAGNYSAIQIAKNGTGIATQVGREAVASANGTFTNTVSVSAYPFNAGDLVTIKANTNTGTPSYSSLLDASEFFFSLARVGN